MTGIVIARAIFAWSHDSYRGVMLPAMGATTCAELREELVALTEALKLLDEALEPSAATKAAYIGEFYETITVANPDFDEGDDSDDAEPEFIEQRIMVSWDTIKQIMAAIRARAALPSAIPHHTDDIIEPLQVLQRKLKLEGLYVSENAVWRAIDEIKRLRAAIFHAPTHRNNSKECVLIGIGKMQSDEWGEQEFGKDCWGQPCMEYHSVNARDVAICRAQDDPAFVHAFKLRAEAAEAEASRLRERVATLEGAAAAVIEVADKAATFVVPSKLAREWRTACAELRAALATQEQARVAGEPPEPFKSGDLVYYEHPDRPIRVNGQVLGTVEGWYELAFADGSKAVVCPSRVHPRRPRILSEETK
jgi:hypothetical protein